MNTITYLLLAEHNFNEDFSAHSSNLTDKFQFIEPNRDKTADEESIETSSAFLISSP